MMLCTSDDNCNGPWPKSTSSEWKFGNGNNDRKESLDNVNVMMRNQTAKSLGRWKPICSNEVSLGNGHLTTLLSL